MCVCVCVCVCVFHCGVVFFSVSLSYAHKRWPAVFDTYCLTLPPSYSPFASSITLLLFPRSLTLLIFSTPIQFTTHLTQTHTHAHSHILTHTYKHTHTHTVKLAEYDLVVTTFETLASDLTRSDPTPQQSVTKEDGSICKYFITHYRPFIFINKETSKMRMNTFCFIKI